MSAHNSTVHRRFNLYRWYIMIFTMMNNDRVRVGGIAVFCVSCHIASA